MGFALEMGVLHDSVAQFSLKHEDPYIREPLALRIWDLSL